MLQLELLSVLPEEPCPGFEERRLRVEDEAVEVEDDGP